MDPRIGALGTLKLNIKLDKTNLPAPGTLDGEYNLAGLRLTRCGKDLQMVRSIGCPQQLGAVMTSCTSIHAVSFEINLIGGPLEQKPSGPIVYRRHTMPVLATHRWLWWLDLNQRMAESKSAALPLGDTTVYWRCVWDLNP